MGALTTANSRRIRRGFRAKLGEQPRPAPVAQPRLGSCWLGAGLIALWE